MPASHNAGNLAPRFGNEDRGCDTFGLCQSKMNNQGLQSESAAAHDRSDGPPIKDTIRECRIFYQDMYAKWLGSRVDSVLDSGTEAPAFKSQSRRCRVTVLGKLFTPIVPLFIKQQNGSSPLKGCGGNCRPSGK